MAARGEWLTIGALAERAGVATSALRFYESEGLLTSERTASGQRRYPRSALRRVAFIRAAQRVGLALHEIRDVLATLPDERTPTRADWQRLSRPWRARVDARIAELERLRDGLTNCIGCGCLSLQRCALYNTGDVAASTGTGARYLLGESPDHGDVARRERPAELSASRPPKTSPRRPQRVTR